MRLEVALNRACERRSFEAWVNPEVAALRENFCTTTLPHSASFLHRQKKRKGESCVLQCENPLGNRPSNDPRTNVDFTVASSYSRLCGRNVDSGHVRDTLAKNHGDYVDTEPLSMTRQFVCPWRSVSVVNKSRLLESHRRKEHRSHARIAALCAPPRRCNKSSSMIEGSSLSARARPERSRCRMHQDIHYDVLQVKGR